MTLVPHRHAMLSTWEPMRPWRLFDRMMGEFFGQPRMVEMEARPWYPSAEIHQTDGELEVSFELPGVPKDTVDIESTEDYLMVKGERQETVQACPEGGACCTEFSYGPFERTIYWPLRVKADQAKANYQDGILHVRVPIAEEEKAKQPKRVTVE